MHILNKKRENRKEIYRILFENMKIVVVKLIDIHGMKSEICRFIQKTASTTIDI